MADEIPSAEISATVRACIEACLKSRFTPSHLRVEDESSAHAGHAGARSGGHFRVLIVSQGFAGHTRIMRHRQIYEALNPWMQKGIHALAITALTPEECSAHAL